MDVQQNKKDIQELHEKLKGIPVAMLTTVEHDSSVRSRPMIALETEPDGNLWFLTLANTAKVNEVLRHHDVNLTYVKPDTKLYVSVSGTTELVRDQKKVKKFWRDQFRPWFSNGPDDPNLALLKVRVENAEYWEGQGVKPSLLYSMLNVMPGAQEGAGVDVKLNIQQ